MIEFFDESDSLPPVIFLLSLLELCGLCSASLHRERRGKQGSDVRYV